MTTDQQPAPRSIPSATLCYVYLLGTSDSGHSKSYVGWTTDLEKRLRAHNTGKGAKSTRGRQWQIIHSECFETRGDAMTREYQLKHDRGARATLLANYHKEHIADMKSYSQMMQEFSASRPDYRVDLSDNWLQGRTAFGGITSALLLQSILNEHENLPPLRTMQVNFIGPAVGTLQISHQMLRRGKNNVTFEARLDSKLGAGTYGYFTFGVNREISIDMDYPHKKITRQPSACAPMVPHVNGPGFLDNFERLLVSGPALLSGADNPDLTIWTRHKDVSAYAGHDGLVPLIVLADAPPAALTALTGLQALSSMNWNINILTDDFSTDDGWWLMRSATDFIRDGYSSQLIEVWNSEGRRVMDSIQHIALFTSPKS